MAPARRGDLSRKAWIVLPAVVLTVADAILTLVFQPATYWAGDFATAHEYSPIGAATLHLHPSVFAGYMLVWLLVVIIVAALLREPWNLVWVLMIVIGHSAGAFDWLEDLDYTPALVTFFAAAFLTVFSWRRAATLHRP